MAKLPSLLALGLAASLAGCQQTPATTTAAPGAPTEAAARTAVARYIQGLPNASRYVPDSARAVEADNHWQLLVPRTDWAQRMPSRAAFEVDKASGIVTTRPVK